MEQSIIAIDEIGIRSLIVKMWLKEKVKVECATITVNSRTWWVGTGPNLQDGWYHRGDWKMESTFSAPSLYFFRPLLFCFSSSAGDTTDPPFTVSPPGCLKSPFID